RTRGADVVQLLVFGGVPHQVIITALLSDDHAFIVLNPWFHEQTDTLLKVKQRIAQHLASHHGHHHTVDTACVDTFLDRPKVVEDMSQNPGTGGQRHKQGAEANQAPGRHDEIKTNPPFAIQHQILQLTATVADLFHDGALV